MWRRENFLLSPIKRIDHHQPHLPCTTKDSKNIPNPSTSNTTISPPSSSTCRGRSTVNTFLILAVCCIFTLTLLSVAETKATTTTTTTTTKTATTTNDTGGKSMNAKNSTHTSHFNTDDTNDTLKNSIDINHNNNNNNNNNNSYAKMKKNLESERERWQERCKEYDWSIEKGW